MNDELISKWTDGSVQNARQGNPHVCNVIIYVYYSKYQQKKGSSNIRNYSAKSSLMLALKAIGGKDAQKSSDLPSI